MNNSQKVLPDHKSEEKLAKEFALFFTNKVSTIHSALKTEQSKVKSNISSVESTDKNNVNSNCNNFGSTCTYDHSVSCTLSEFTVLSENDVVNLVNKSNAKSCLLDPLPTWYIKEFINTFVSVITRIMNMSLSTGIFPDIWKQAIINPLIKKPSLDSNELKNYRPVANISFMSKLIEKHVFNCINEHMDINNVGEELQSAYRSIHSTETALLQVKTDIMTYLHQQEGVFVVLLDLSAAFDTVEHTILLNRMASEIGLTGTALKWMESYFTGRTTKVGVNGTYSKPQSMQYGLPQGSIVGPGSFKIYIIPIGRIIRKHGLKYHLYADDIQLYISFNPSDPNSILTALAKLSACINEIRMWMTGNMLMLNDSKTEFFVAVSQNNSSKMPPVHLQIGTEIIKPSATVRNLGVLFDTHMTMSPHISGLSKTTSFQLRNISRIRRFLDQDTCHHVTRSLILNRLDYCNSLLLGSTQTDLTKLQRLQNWAAKLIYCATKRDHATPYLKKLHWLPIQERILFKILVFVYKCLNHSAPEYLAGNLHLHIPTRTGLRSSSDTTRLDEYRLFHGYLQSAADRSFYYTAPELWNKLPEALRSSCTLEIFKKELKTHIFPN